MERVVVIGCGGSGKTRLSNKLAKILDLPVTHLDVIYYDDKWNALDKCEFSDKQREVVAGSRWLIEGNYASTLPIRLAEADTVIFLDLSTVSCLLGVIQRRWRYRGGRHISDGVCDRITLGFISYIIGYRRAMRPRVQSLLNEFAGECSVIVLTGRRKVDEFVRTLSLLR